MMSSTDEVVAADSQSLEACSGKQCQERSY